MVTVYVWRIKFDMSQDDLGVGHAAAKLENGTYVSFWPAETDEAGESAPRRRKKKKWGSTVSDHLRMDVPCAVSKNYFEDCAEEEREADSIIEINHLDESAMERYWNKVLKDETEFHLLKCNCSTVVGRTLDMGYRHSIGNSVLSGDFSSLIKTLRVYRPDNISRMIGLLTTALLWTPADVALYAEVLREIKK